ncbi:hypothetical protein GALL_372010 [mine drainage metagenome]|uniref:Uncharacterized protein n=1 Tax=mine drainage metagenome TaxID=410659 RepID=A0A1J5QC83_9ZZZZ
MLGRDVVVAERTRLLAGRVDQHRHRARRRRLGDRRARGAGETDELGPDLAADRRTVGPDRVEETAGDAGLLREQRAEQVRRLEVRVAGRGRLLDRVADRFLRLGRELEVHRVLLSVLGVLLGVLERPARANGSRLERIPLNSDRPARGSGAEDGPSPSPLPTVASRGTIDPCPTTRRPLPT